ncbi:MAG TPA: cytochrome P450 [Terriglobales bacterium]|nr:cytochrome P450 [Terriglobales bacterium]
MTAQATALATPDPQTDAKSRPLHEFDMSDPRYYQQDIWQPYFARLRREAPVHYCADSPYGPYWSLTRYQEIMQCSTNHIVFSNAGNGISLMDVEEQDMDRRGFIRMDPPRHTAQRKVVSPIFAPSNLKNMEALIRRRTCDVLDALPRNETFDWVEHVAVNLTTMMLATLLDFPFEERTKLTHWSQVAIANLADPDSPIRTEEERRIEMRQMAEHMRGLLDERRDLPPHFDLISMLAHNEATRDMPFPELVGNMMLLIVAGNDTTRNSMSGGLLALHEFPGEYRKLQAHPELVETTVPEIIRYVSPAIHLRRTAMRDTVLGGQPIPAGAKVILWYISGNRDEEAIDQPDRFMVDRPHARQHVAFGAGIHRCVGDRLAELQLRILWEEILPRFPMIEVVGEPVRSYSNVLRGIRSLPVRIPG